MIRRRIEDAPLTPEQQAEIESLMWDMDFPRPHEGTAAERGAA